MDLVVGKTKGTLELITVSYRIRLSKESSRERMSTIDLLGKEEEGGVVFTCCYFRLNIGTWY